MTEQLGYIGRRDSTRLWYVPYTARARWRSAGCRIIRRATLQESSAARLAYGAGNRPVPLHILDSQAAPASDAGAGSPPSTTVVVAPVPALDLVPPEGPSVSRRRAR
jgi:hypothetical protein